MGKRKAKRKAPPKPPRAKLEKEFNCPICSADKSVEVQLNRKTGTGTLLCRGCQHSFQTAISTIDVEVDVMAQWIDAVEEGAYQTAQNFMQAEEAPVMRSPKRGRRQLHYPEHEEEELAGYDPDAEVYDEAEDRRYSAATTRSKNATGVSSDAVYAEGPPSAEHQEDDDAILEEEEEFDFGESSRQQAPQVKGRLAANQGWETDDD